MMQVINVIFLCLLGAVLFFFLTPKFIQLCESFGELIAVVIENFVEAVKDTVREWKELFKRWQK